MKFDLINFLVGSGWKVNTSHLWILAGNGTTLYGIGESPTTINTKEAFTINQITEIDLDFQHHSAKIWTEE